ncbi:MAG TPA: tetratricopeptide repeat protein, partial [Stenomitos sp.]
AFARANYALALYQTGQKEEALRTLRNIIRKYPQFPDVRAALTAALWVDGKQGEAESNWAAVVGLDNRYKDLEWVKSIRRWPPVMVAALEKFLTLSSR